MEETTKDELAFSKQTGGAGAELSSSAIETAGAGTETKKSFKARIKRRFTSKRLALMAVFIALSYAVSLLEFPIFPATPFLKLDFGNVFILLISFLSGPIEGIIVCVIKELFRILGSSSGGVGEIANMFVTILYILLPSVFYRFKKGLKGVSVCLAFACLIGTAAALFANRYINYPLYMGDGAAQAFSDTFWFIVAFNLIKTSAIGLLTILLYKRLSNFLKRMKI